MTAANKKGSAFVDDESKGAIYEGVNLSQMMQIFKLDYRTVQKKVFESGVKPVGKRYGADIYAIHEIAPYLVKPAFDPETYVRKMDPKDLPKMLTKEYWAGQRSKQDYEEKAGLLWRTEKVVEEVGELYKIMKMSALLMLDAVERQTDLSERQRSIIKGLTHGMLNDAQSRITDRFKVPKDVQPQEAEDDQEL